MKCLKHQSLPIDFVKCPKTFKEEVEDYKQIFTDIISDRIKEKFK